jgi:hypothetical protein
VNKKVTAANLVSHLSMNKYGYILLTLIFAQLFLCEKVAASKLTVFDITRQICDAIQARAYTRYVALPTVYELVRCYVTLELFIVNLTMFVLYFSQTRTIVSLRASWRVFVSCMLYFSHVSPCLRT